jgi:hypothetical protein
MSVCDNCGRQLREGMSFCPGCGVPIGKPGGPPMGHEPVAPPAAGNPMGGPYPAMYPMPYAPSPYMPGPMMYPPPISAKRAAAIGGGVIMIVSGGLSLIASLIFLIDSWWVTDLWLPLGILNIVAFTLSIVGAIGIFRRSWHVVIVVSMIVILVVSIASVYDLTFFAIIIMILAIVTVVLVAVSWSDTRAGPMVAYQPYPIVQPMGVGAPPPVPAPRVNIRTGNHEQSLRMMGPAEEDTSRPGDDREW